MAKDWNEPELIEDAELVQSIRRMQQQRATRLLLVVLGIAAALAVAAASVYVAFSEEPEAVPDFEPR